MKEDFFSMYKSLEEDTIRQIFDFEGPILESTLRRVVVKKFGRVPSESEIRFWGAGVVDIKAKKVHFYWAGELLFTATAVLEENGVVDRLEIEEFI